MRCIVLLAVGAASCGPAADPPAARDGAAIGADAAEIARSLEVTPAEAARRLRAQAVLGDHLARLRVAHANRLAGVYYQHHPGFSAVVRVKGNAPVRAHPLNRSPVDGAPIEFRPGASMTLDELQAARDRHADALRAIQGLQGHGIDERTGTVRLTVHAPGREGAVGSRIADLQARLGLPLTVDFVPDPVIAGTVGSR